MRDHSVITQRSEGMLGHRFCDNALRILKGRGGGVQAYVTRCYKNAIKTKKTRTNKHLKTSERYVTGKGGRGQAICYEALHSLGEGV